MQSAPANPKTFFSKKIILITKLVLGAILIPSISIGVFVFLEKQGIFNINAIEIVVENPAGQTIYLKPLVKELDANLETNRGLSLWKVDVRQLHHQLLQQSWVQEATITRRWPSKLSVAIQVKEIRLLLITKDGRFSPIVENGELLPPIALKQLPDVAILQGENFEKKSDLRKKAVSILEEIPKKGAFSQQAISEIHYDDKDGFWMTLVKDGVRVKLGQDQISIKSARISQVIEYVDSRKMDARVIDANLSKKVLVKLRKEP